MYLFFLIAVVLSVLMTPSPGSTEQTSQSQFSHIAGMQNLVSVSVSGVWAIDPSQDVWYREGTFNNPESPGTHWMPILGKKLVHLDVGKSVIWGVDHNHNVYVRHNLTCNTPFGTHWEHVPGPIFKQVSVSPRGNVWAIHFYGDVYFRLGISRTNQVGTEWLRIRGAKMKYISAGRSGVWAIAQDEDKVYYRVGTFGDTGVMGMGWMSLPGNNQVQSLCSGDNRVIAVSARGEIHVRSEMFTSSPVGIFWNAMPGRLNQVDCHADDVWGVNDTKVYFNTVLLN